MEFKHIFLFVGFHWIQIENLTAYRIQSVHWKYHISLFVHQETKKQGQNDCYEKRKSFTLAIVWKDCELFPKLLILNLLWAGETLNSSQMDGIANIYFFFVRKYTNWSLLGEYKKISEKYIFFITTKIVGTGIKPKV